jgi:hypothetical protein
VSKTGSPRVALRPQTFVLTGIAGICCAAAVALLYLVFVQGLGYRYWPDNSEVPRDGRVHVVGTVADQTFIVWKNAAEGFDAPCKLTDVVTGTPVHVWPTEVLGDRPDGSAGPSMPWREGTAKSGRTLVQCDNSPEMHSLYVTAPPRSFIFETFGPWAYGICGLAALGLVVLATGALTALAACARRRVAHLGSGHP